MIAIGLEAVREANKRSSSRSPIISPRAETDHGKNEKIIKVHYKILKGGGKGYAIWGD